MHTPSLFSVSSTPTALLVLLAASSHAIVAEAISGDEIAALCPASAYGQMKCIEDGSQFVLCNGLSSVPQAVGLGTKCVDGLIQFAGVHDGEVQSSVVLTSSSTSSVGGTSIQSTTTGTTTSSSSPHSVRTITIHESASSSLINATTATATFKLSSDPGSGNNRSFDFAKLKSDMQLIYPLFHAPPKSSKNQSVGNNTVAATGVTTSSEGRGQGSQSQQPTATTMTVTHTNVVTLSASSVPRSTSTVMVTVGLSTFTALPG